MFSGRKKRPRANKYFNVCNCWLLFVNSWLFREKQYATFVIINRYGSWTIYKGMLSWKCSVCVPKVLKVVNLWLFLWENEDNRQGTLTETKDISMIYKLRTGLNRKWLTRPAVVKHELDFVFEVKETFFHAFVFQILHELLFEVWFWVRFQPFL